VRVLLDTCILAELRRSTPDPGVRAAVAQVDDADLFLSVLTVGEIAKGIARLAGGRKKTQLTAWLRGLEENFSDRLLADDHEAATIWGEALQLVNILKDSADDREEGRRYLPAGVDRAEIFRLARRDIEVAVEHEAATIWGEITARAQAQGITVPAVDGLLAATALRHGLHFMTRNTKHVVATGVLLINPWERPRR